MQHIVQFMFSCKKSITVTSEARNVHIPVYSFLVETRNASTTKCMSGYMQLATMLCFSQVHIVAELTNYNCLFQLSEGTFLDSEKYRKRNEKMHGTQKHMEGRAGAQKPLYKYCSLIRLVLNPYQIKKRKKKKSKSALLIISFVKMQQVLKARAYFPPETNSKH